MQSTLTTLLIITSAVIFACVTVTYALTTAEQAVHTLPKMEGIKNLESVLLNETNSMFNQTIGLPTPEAAPP